MPRKSKAQMTSVVASYDSQIFASVDATKRFEEKAIHKAIIPQRGVFVTD